MLPRFALHRAGHPPAALATFAAAALAFCTIASSTPLLAQSSPRRLAMHHPMRRGAMMMSDPAARLLDQQTLLQLSGPQVARLIAIHESARTQQRALADKMRSMFPRPQGRRAAPTAAQRDSMASLIDAIRTARWRATSGADSVLTPDQRRQAARLELARRSAMRRPGGRGGVGGWSHGAVRGDHQPNRAKAPSDNSHE